MTDPLRDHLREIHEELGRVGAIDPTLRAPLIEVLGDITRLLGSTPPPPRDLSLERQLEALAVRFEVQHPDLGAALRRALDSLSNVGI